MSDAEKRIEQLLNSPIGCAFLIEVEAHGLTPEAVVPPEHCLWVVARAVDLLRQHTDGHDAVEAAALAHGPRLRPLARAFLEHPGVPWWFEPLDPARQVWIAGELGPLDTGAWQRPASPPTRWERYAQKPIGNQCTSTLVGDTSSLLVAHNQRVGDYWGAFPMECWELRISPDVRVFQVHGPEDWHQLCVRYPARGTNPQGKEDGRLTPDWGAAARDWDGVHLSIGGLLTAEQVRCESPQGWSELEFWHAEQTFWLRNVSTGARRLPDWEERDLPESLALTGCDSPLVTPHPLEAVRSHSGTPLIRFDP